MYASCVRLAVREGLENPEMIRWLKRAAESGDAVAQTNLGRCYELGAFPYS
jgi:TPR repeat protein